MTRNIVLQINIEILSAQYKIRQDYLEMDSHKQEPFGTLRTQMMDLQQSEESSDWSSNSYTDFKSVLSYCLMILGGPVLAFFVTRFVVLGGILGMDPSAIRSEVISAVVAVVVLHIALGNFIVRAYFSGNEKEKIGKSD